MKARLQLIVNWIQEENNLFKIADIGTDHGLVPLWLAKANPQLCLFASDIVPAAIEILKDKIQNYPNIKTFVGFGLNPLQDQEIDLCIIAGMGVPKMLKILKLDSHKQKHYIFQGVENPIDLRRWVQKKGYLIKKEAIIKEKTHYYHTLFVSKTSGLNVNDENDCYFGPYLKKHQDVLFKEYWNKIWMFKEKVMPEINNPDDLDKMKQELAMIEKMIKND